MSGGRNGGSRRHGALPARRPGRDGTATVGTLGEGLLEVGVHPELSDELLARGYGGDAANAAVMAARMGAEARLLSRVGGDAAGRLLLEFWERSGVDVRGVDIDPEGVTGIYINEVDGDGQHAFSYHRAGTAASRMAVGAFDDHGLRGLDVLHVTGIGLSISDAAATTSEQAVAAARADGAAISFGANFRPQLNPDRARLVAAARSADLVFLSVEDARFLLGTDDPSAIVAALGPSVAEVILTQGAEPAWLFAGGEILRVAPPAITLADAAGAGDALAGAYLSRRFAGGGPLESLTTGVAAGALSCRDGGCARTYPSATEVTAAVAALGAGRPVVSG